MPTEEQHVEAGELIGTTIAGFRIVSVLGRHADGTVSCAVTSLQTEEAATLRLAPAVGGTAFEDRFLRDARLLARVEHSSLLPVSAVGNSPEGAYVVSEGVAPGRTLSSVVGGGLALEHGLRLMGDVADALDAVHAVGLLHGGLSPAAIVVGEWLVVRPLLVNFALGRASHAAAETGDIERVPYTSPEELRGDSVGPPADRYALACTLFELLTGCSPFGSTRDAVLHGHVSELPRSGGQSGWDLPPALVAVFRRALAEAPEERYGSAAELVSVVARALFDPMDTVADEQSDLELDVEPEADAIEPEPEQEEPEPGAEQEEAEPGAEQEEPEQEEPEPEEPEPEQEEREPEQGEPELEPDTEPGEPLPSRPTKDLTGAEQPFPPLPTPDDQLAATRPRASATVPLWAAIAVIALAAAVGLLLGGVSKEDRPARMSITAGPLKVEVPTGWAREPSLPKIAGLDLERAVAIGPGSGRGGMVAGFASDRRAVLDPALVARGLGSSPPSPTAVRMGGLEAYRFDGLRTRDSGHRVDLYLAPTSAGALTLACYRVGPTGEPPSGCDRAAGSVRLTDGTPYSLLRAARWREQIRVAMGRLSERRAKGLRRLNEAETPADQAAATDALAVSYGTAIRALKGNRVPPQATDAQRRLLGSAQDLERAYRNLARAAREGDPMAYTAAERVTRSADARLRRNLRSI